MNTLTTGAIKELASLNAQTSVSIYMPTDQTGMEARKSGIRLRNILSEVEAQLLNSGIRVPDVEKLLAPAHHLTTQGEFWRYQQAGLAIFIAPNFFRTIPVSQRVEVFVRVADRFHLKPLFSSIGADIPFLLLAISQKELRLYEGDSESLREVQLEGVPTSYMSFSAAEVPDKQLQHHAVPRGSGNLGGQAIFHGSGPDDLGEKDDLLRYFRKVDAELRDVLEGDRRPMVLAAVDYIRALYARANTYAALLGDGIAGSPEGINPQVLHGQALEIVRPMIQERHARVADTYRSLSNTRRVSAELEQILRAAHYGQIETLLLQAGESVWGRFSPEHDVFETHPERMPFSDDLLDLAAVETFRSGGMVQVLPEADMPVDAPAAALFHYELEIV